MNSTMTRWNPLRELEEFQNRILGAFNPNSSRHSSGQESLTFAEWMPFEATREATRIVELGLLLRLYLNPALAHCSRIVRKLDLVFERPR